jgi:hypothetical protein
MCLGLCSKKGFDVQSYGTGSVVKLPGPASEQPNVYEFGTTYEYMYQDLLKKDPNLYPFIMRPLCGQWYRELGVSQFGLLQAIAFNLHSFSFPCR